MPDYPEFEEDIAKLSDGGVISVDEVLQCLSNPVRRHILYYCRENEVTNLTELAQHIVALDDDVGPEETADDSLERCKVNLVHNHLPKLMDTNALEYDRRSKTIRYDDPPRLFDWLLRALARIEGWDTF
jgi:DNA-binding transcriptional ArsR family regulator